MEMTYNEYLNKLDSIVETALFNYDAAVMTITESAEGSDENSLAIRESSLKAKAKAVVAVVTKAVKAAWDAIIRFIDTIIEKLISFKTTGKMNAKMRATATFDVAAAVLDYDHIFDKLLSDMANADTNEKIDAVEAEMENWVANKEYVTFEKDQTIEQSVLTNTYRSLKSYRNLDKKVGKALKIIENEKEVDSDLLSPYKKTMIKIGARLNDIITDCKKMLAHCKTASENKGDGSSDFDYKAAMEEAKKEATNESVSLADQLRATAQSLLEDANIQTDDAVQKDIDDIPEADVAKDDEYPADDVTGGEGQKPNKEEIKELIGNDKEAMDALTNDEGSKAITESANVVIRF